MVQHKIGDQTEFSLIPQIGSQRSFIPSFAFAFAWAFWSSPVRIKSYKSGELMMPSFINQCKKILTFQLPSY
jgi:hypothetical protein